MLIQLYGTQVKFDVMDEATLKNADRKLKLCQVTNSDILRRCHIFSRNK
jgi:uncharacterized ubiquitin-like protein YukD